MQMLGQLVVKVGLPLLIGYIFGGVTGLGIAAVIVWLINIFNKGVLYV